MHMCFVQHNKYCNYKLPILFLKKQVCPPLLVALNVFLKFTRIKKCIIKNSPAPHASYLKPGDKMKLKLENEQ